MPSKPESDISMDQLPISTELTAKVHEYMTGKCHILAVALHREFGCGFLLLTNNAPDQSYSVGVPAVLHVYADDGQGNLYDALGAHSCDNVIEQWRSEDEGSEPDVEFLDDEDELGNYVSDDFDAPLESYTDEDVEQALALAQELGLTALLAIRLGVGIGKPFP